MNYIAILLTFVFVGVLCLAMLILGIVLGPKKTNKVKPEPFECGVESKIPAKTVVFVKFYVVAMLFILFDIEIIFFYPWAIVFRELNIFGMVEMLIFIGLMLAGYIYVIKKGALEWK